FPPFSRILEFDQSGFDPTATMGFDRSLREPVVEGAVTIRLKQEFHYRLAGLHTLHSAPSEHDFAVRNHLEEGALDGNADWPGDAKSPAGARIGLDELCQPNPHMRWVGQNGEPHFRGSVDADLEPYFELILAHLLPLLRAIVSAACFSRRNRE